MKNLQVSLISINLVAVIITITTTTTLQIKSFSVAAAASNAADDVYLNSWKNCEYNNEAEVVAAAPWTVIIQSEKKSEKLNCSSSNCIKSKLGLGTILNEYTIITSGRSFVGPGNKLQLLPWKNYTIYIGQQNNNISNLANPIQVSYVKPYSSIYRDKTYWMNTANDFVLIYLKTPIQFTTNVRPVCLLPSSESTVSNWTKANSTMIVAGWKKDSYDTISLNINLNSLNECQKIWYSSDDTKNFNFSNDRVCGVGSAAKGNKNNPTKECINKDSGSILRPEEDSKLYFTGFISKTYENEINGVCDEKSLHYTSLTSPDVLAWINAGIKCGPFQYTCDNGQCIPTASICNTTKECSDGSDEDPRYCRALKYCNEKTEFECGIYGDCISKINAKIGRVAKNCNGVQDCPGGEDEGEESCPSKPEEPVKPLIVGLAGSCLGILFILPISVFIWRRSQRHRNLTEDEIKEFYNGGEEEVKCNNEVENTRDDVLLDVRNIAFDHSFEYDRKECDLGPIIGKGEFGIVRLAKLQSKTVVVKIPLKGSVDIDQIKALLVELKFNIYVQLMGGHPNIVQLVGAYTQQIRKRILHVAFEYCEHGNLLAYIVKNKSFFKNEFNESGNKSYSELLPKPGYIFADSLVSFTTLDLIQWAIQIARGMAFLLSKKIIHGDLALRNILLDSKRNAKICDFGLSRQLYKYDIYKMKTQISIPWQWMAIEVLERHTFHIKSDVWSYAIALWELFTLGCEPWAGMACSPTFIQQLRANFRLYKPEFANDQIFNIISHCWNCSPEERPDFVQVVQSLKNILDMPPDVYKNNNTNVPTLGSTSGDSALSSCCTIISISDESIVKSLSNEEVLQAEFQHTEEIFPLVLQEDNHSNQMKVKKLPSEYLSYESCIVFAFIHKTHPDIAGKLRVLQY